MRRLRRTPGSRLRGRAADGEEHAPLRELDLPQVPTRGIVAGLHAKPGFDVLLGRYFEVVRLVVLEEQQAPRLAAYGLAQTAVRSSERLRRRARPAG